MRFKGRLAKWNDDRGFGFITPAEAGSDVFVHISAFPKDGRRPQANEVISYCVERTADGKSRAVDVRRTAIDRLPASRRPLLSSRTSRTSRTSRIGAISLLVLCGLVAYGYSEYETRFAARQRAPDSSTVAEFAVDNDALGPARCDGRTRCSQMTSCEEAQYFLKHCPGVQMDGNNDGEPCEQQWCN